MDCYNPSSEILAVKCDVGKILEVQKFISSVKKKFGKIDYLVNNAGTAVYKPIEKTTEDDWDSMIDTNLKGVFLVTKYALPLMSKELDGKSLSSSEDKRHPVIINVSSSAGKYGFANFTAYCASKFGVIGFTKSLADELKESGEKVYAVCPGGVNTKLYHSLWPGEDPKKLIPPENVAKKIVELCFSRKQKNGSSVNIYNLRDMREYVLRKM